MHPVPTNSIDALSRLQALAQSGRLPAREVDRCAHLLDTLSKPVRVCLMGPVHSDLRTLLYAILGTDIAPDGLALPPAIEMRHGDRVRTQATLEDGSHLSCEGWPDAELLAEAPVFLQLDAPNETLSRMSFLALSLDVNPAMHRPALSWAARRTEIAVWCTPSFSVADARIWGNAPERLTHRAYLVETQPRPNASRTQSQGEFTGYLHLPMPDDISALLTQLDADIDEARMADVDAAQLLLHRLGHLGSEIEASLNAESSEQTRSAGQLARLRQVLSEPILYLSRRARALSEDLAWIDPATDEDWPQDALSHCSETAEALRDRVSEWPEDLPEFATLSDMIDEATDLILLLQMEAGIDQVEDAVGLLHQLRGAFDACRLGHGVAA